MTSFRPAMGHRPQAVSAFAPASVANIAVGFDVLGYAMDRLGDIVHVEKIAEPGVTIAPQTSDAIPIQLVPERNTAGAALLALIRDQQLPFGFHIRIDKGIPLSSGMGGSAASCVAALVAANALLDTPLTHAQLYPYALDGELVASGQRHGDNVGPALLGGVVICGHDRLVPLTVPARWHSLLVHPDLLLETRYSRQILAKDYPLSTITQQQMHLALLMAGCFSGDAQLVMAGLQDVLIEPQRAPLIQGFAQAKHAAMAAGALGAGISGGGPSLFAWFVNASQAQAAAGVVQAAFAAQGVTSQYWVTPIISPGARLL